MAKLTDLKSLFDAARRDVSGTRAPKPATSTACVAGQLDRSNAAASGSAQKLAAPKLRLRDAQRAAMRRNVAAAKHAEADIDIAHTFADVKRLPAHNRAHTTRPRPIAVPRLRIEDERAALEMSKYGVEPAPQSWEIGQEIESGQTFLRRGLGTDILVKLRRDHWAVQSVLDLHGMTTDAAHDTLADFLLEARNRGLRCVRIIHGKGLTSPNREPVLKGKVRRWLSQWNDVLAYCEAARHAGK